ncbi:MAG TPA: four helix bundle protein [Chthonomonadaceae bacterium]|nr:four helix bundle protein [Chthonomonadaceae bacterium]
MGKIESHRDLIVWQKSIDMAVQVYRLTEKFPSHEKFGLTSQLTRAAASVAANIAEGNARGSTKDYAHFLSIARGSLMETETFLILATRLDYLHTDDLQTCLALIHEIDRMLIVLRSRLQP